MLNFQVYRHVQTKNNFSRTDNIELAPFAGFDV